MAIYEHKLRPSCVEPPIAQIATAIGDLQDDFRWIQGLTDFLQEELTRVDPAPWPAMRQYLLVQALEHRVELPASNWGGHREVSWVSSATAPRFILKPHAIRSAALASRQSAPRRKAGRVARPNCFKAEVGSVSNLKTVLMSRGRLMEVVALALV